jgi:hypothetical protein
VNYGPLTSRLSILVLVLTVCLGLFAGAHTTQAEAPATPADLQASLQNAIDASGFDIAIAVTDLQTGETIGVREFEPRLTGCTINVMVLIQATLDMQAGLLSREQVDWTLREVIRWSEPHRSKQLVELIGAGDLQTGAARVRELIASLGLSTAVFDHPPAYDGDSLALLPPTPVALPPQHLLEGQEYGWYEREILEWVPPEHVPDNLISAVDMNTVLAALWRGEILNPEWTQYLLGAMTGVSGGLQYLLGSSGGGSAVVSHKNGYYWTPDGWTDNDVGIVRFKVAGVEHAYAVSYYAAQLDAELGDVGIGQRLMSIIWNYFRQKYG